MKSIKYLVVLVCMTFASVSLFAQEKELQTESDGFQWYKLYQNEKRGAQSKSGTTLIPLSRGYTFICYHTMDGGWFSVDKGNKEYGVCDITGKEIIAPGRYDDAYYRNKDGYVYVDVKLNGKEGVCDGNGREIIAPRYESLICSDGVFEYKDASGNWVSTGVSLDGSSSYASNNQSSSNSSSASYGSVGHTLLYKDYYWICGQFGDVDGLIEIYSDCIVMAGMSTIPFKSLRGDGERVYTTGDGPLFVVDGTFNIRRENSLYDCTFRKKNSNSGNYGGGSGTYNGGTGNGGNQGGGGLPSPQSKQHQCGLCKGSGRTIKTDGTSFGNTKYCSECGKTVPDYHYHSACESCKGKGWW